MSLPKRILVVDDEPNLRATLAATIELDGFEVIEARDAAEALAITAAQRFDLVLTDIRMPGMNGVELFRALRRRGGTMPVLLMTGFAVEQLVTEALEEGVFTVLHKPFDVSQVIRTLHRAAQAPEVLVVDDSEELTRATCASLQASGVPARGVKCGHEALEVLKKGVTDLCVVDLVMPRMSGPELARRARELDPGLGIIAISGEDVPELVRQAAREGMYSFLQKPFTMRTLVRTIGMARAERALGPARRAGR
jgi:DNA-binding NtrC family response regulator